MTLRNNISDTLVLAKRSILRIPRAPDLLLSFTVQPIMFVLLFVYVFGGCDQHAGLRLRRLPDAWDHRADDGLRRLRHRAGPCRGPEEGPGRPLSLPADVPFGGAGGPHPGRRRHQPDLAGDHDRRWDARRFLLRRSARPRHRRHRPDAALWLRLFLGLCLHRALLLLTPSRLRSMRCALFLGTPAGSAIWGAVAWSIGIAAVFAALSVARYKRAVAR